MIWRVLPLIAMLMLTGIALVWRPWLQYRRYGTLGIVVFRSSNRWHNVRDALVTVGFALAMWQAFAGAFYALGPRLPIDGHLALFSNVTGAILMFGGLFVLVWAQLDLGASWRIGIEEGARLGLVTDGLYRYSRNPIFAGLLAMIVGYALLLPTWLSLGLLVGAYIGVRRQISAEETYLLKTYAEAYRTYARRVGRFLPGIGRLR